MAPTAPTIFRGGLLLALLVLLCVGPSRDQTTGNTLRCGSEAELLDFRKAYIE